MATSLGWRIKYQQAHEIYFKVKCPQVYAAGLYTPPKYPNVKTANGLSLFACNYFTYLGQRLERTNNMGRRIDNRKTYVDVLGHTRQIGSIEWQKGTGERGTSDLKGHFKPFGARWAIPVYIEVKAGKDRMSQEQKEYMERVTSTGAMHLILRTPEDLYQFVDYLKTLK